MVEAERTVEPTTPEEHGKAALTELFEEARNDRTPIIVKRIVNDIDEIVRHVRFKGWQTTHAGRAGGEEGCSADAVQVPPAPGPGAVRPGLWLHPPVLLTLARTPSAKSTPTVATFRFALGDGGIVRDGAARGVIRWRRSGYPRETPPKSAGACHTPPASFVAMVERAPASLGPLVSVAASSPATASTQDSRPATPAGPRGGLPHQLAPLRPPRGALSGGRSAWDTGLFCRGRVVQVHDQHDLLGHLPAQMSFHKLRVGPHLRPLTTISKAHPVEQADDPMSLSRVSFIVLSGIRHPLFRVTPARRRPAISSAETITAVASRVALSVSTLCRRTSVFASHSNNPVPSPEPYRKQIRFLNALQKQIVHIFTYILKLIMIFFIRAHIPQKSTSLAPHLPPAPPCRTE